MEEETVKCDTMAKVVLAHILLTSFPRALYVVFPMLLDVSHPTI